MRGLLILLFFLITGILASDLYDAINDEDFEAFKSLIQDPSINLKSIMACVVIKNLPQFAEYLLDNGVDASNLSEEYDFLGFAVDKNSNETLQILLDHGVNPDSHQSLALAVYCNNEEAVRILLDAGADPNLGEFGETPLLIAAKKDRKDIARMLLCHGADPSISDEKGVNSLMQAVCRRNSDMVKIILESGIAFDVDSQTKSGITSLMYACTVVDLISAELLLDHGANPNTGNSCDSTALHCILTGQIVEDNKLRKQSNYYDLEDVFGLEKTEHDVSAEVNPDRLMIIQLLIERGADFHRLNANGISPFDIVQENLNSQSFRTIQTFLRSINCL